MLVTAILNFFFLTSAYFHLRSFSTLLHFSAEYNQSTDLASNIIFQKTHQGIQTSIITANTLSFPLPTSLEQQNKHQFKQLHTIKQETPTQFSILPDSQVWTTDSAPFFVCFKYHTGSSDQTSVIETDADQQKTLGVTSTSHLVLQGQL